MRALILVTIFSVTAGAGCAPAPAERDDGPAPPPISTEAPPDLSTPGQAASERGARLPAEAPPPPADLAPPAPVAAPPEPPAPPRDPLQQMRDDQMQSEDRRLALGRAENRVKAAQWMIDVLEKRLLAVRNPFLPRPQLPPEEAKVWEGLDGAGRAQRVEDQIVAARAELEEAKKAFVALGGRLD